MNPQMLNFSSEFLSILIVRVYFQQISVVLFAIAPSADSAHT